MGVNSTSTCYSPRGAWLQVQRPAGLATGALAASGQDSPDFVARPGFADASDQGRHDLLDD